MRTRWRLTVAVTAVAVRRDHHPDLVTSISSSKMIPMTRFKYFVMETKNTKCQGAKLSSRWIRDWCHCLCGDEIIKNQLKIYMKTKERKKEPSNSLCVCFYAGDAVSCTWAPQLLLGGGVCGRGGTGTHLCDALWILNKSRLLHSSAIVVCIAARRLYGPRDLSLTAVTASPCGGDEFIAMLQSNESDEQTTTIDESNFYYRRNIWMWEKWGVTVTSVEFQSISSFDRRRRRRFLRTLW